MLFKPLAFAATAAAFLVVPEITEPEEDVVRVLPVQAEPFELPATALSQSLEVPCLQCKGHDTSLHFDFAIERGSALTLNGFELYPGADPWNGDLVASVVEGSGDEQEQRLGYSLLQTAEGMDEDLQMKVYGVEIRVIEVGGRFIDGIPAVKVKVIEAATGELIIGNVEIKEISDTECDIWCRAKETFGGLFKGFKGCSGHHHKGHKGSKAHGGHANADGAEGHREHGGHHEHHGHHGMKHHGMKHHRHGWGKLVKNIVAHIFLPVVMGVVAGVGVAMYVVFLLNTSSIVLTMHRLAMFVCSVVVRLTTFIKGGRSERSWCPHRRAAKAAQAEAAADEEKSGLMENVDAPPQYEEGVVKV